MKASVLHDVEKTKRVTAETLSSKAFLKFVLSFHSSHSHGRFSCTQVSCTQRRQFSHTKLILNCSHQFWVWGYWGSSVCLQGPSSCLCSTPAVCGAMHQVVSGKWFTSKFCPCEMFSFCFSLQVNHWLKRKWVLEQAMWPLPTFITLNCYNPQLINRDSLKGTLLNGEVSFPFRLPTAFLYIASFFNTKFHPPDCL